jgi:hypothetical protein
MAAAVEDAIVRGVTVARPVKTNRARFHRCHGKVPHHILDGKSPMLQGASKIDKI